VLLKFSRKPTCLFLEFWTPVNSIRNIISDLKKKELSIVYENRGKDRILHLSNVEHLEEILSKLNPIQMLEKRIELAEQNNMIN
jgi:hypothetical protein